MPTDIVVAHDTRKQASFQTPLPEGRKILQPSSLHCCRPPPASPTVAPPAIVSSVIDLPLHSSGRLQIDAVLLCCLLPDRAFHRGEPHTGVVGEGVRRARAGDWRASRAMAGLRRSGRAARAGGSGSARTPGSQSTGKVYMRSPSATRAGAASTARNAHAAEHVRQAGGTGVQL